MSRKSYSPKPLDPGTTVEWRMIADDSRRTGTVWAKGPEGPRTLWVIPDSPLAGEAAAVLVHVSQPRGQQPSLTQADYGPQHEASRADFQRALAQGYRIAWDDPKAG